MPIYEYRCQSCGHQFELMQRFSDAPATECPECKAPQLKKLVSNTSFQLKGSGWYVTDYGKGGSGPKPPEGKAESKGSDSKTETKSESKAESSKTESSKPESKSEGSSST